MGSENCQEDSFLVEWGNMRKVTLLWKISLTSSIVFFLLFWVLWGLWGDSHQVLGKNIWAIFYIGAILFLTFLGAFVLYLIMRSKSVESKYDLPKRFHYSFATILFTFFAIFTFVLVPWNTIIGMTFAISVGLGIGFSYKSIRQRKLSDKIVGILCLVITGFLGIITVLDFFLNLKIL